MGRIFQTLGLCVGLSLSAAQAGAENWTCRHASVQDGLTGAYVEGIEDIAWDKSRNRLYLSAYNRRAEGAYGAIYALDFSSLDKVNLTVTPLEAAGSLRPHGVTYHQDRLWAIDRQNLAHPVLREFKVSDLTLEDVSQQGGDAICHANDIAIAKGQVFVTNDRNPCTGFKAWFAQIFGTASGQVKVAGDKWRPLGSELNFPNGIAPWKDGLLISATRANVLYYLSFDGQILNEVELDYAPDNLSIGDDGAVYFTGFDSLIGYAWFRSDKSNREDAPSHVFRMSADGEVDELALLPENLPAGATVAIRVQNKLIIGSAFDHGLGVCTLKDGQ
ncbi:MAG: hypothetical protein PVF65_10495 [Sphingomonadales bacterium]|jgi:sugar lactone lactonase YvrE